jgi:hypothetical protein
MVVCPCGLTNKMQGPEVRLCSINKGWPVFSATLINVPNANTEPIFAATVALPAASAVARPVDDMTGAA